MAIVIDIHSNTGLAVRPINQLTASLRKLEATLKAVEVRMDSFAGAMASAAGSATSMQRTLAKIPAVSRGAGGSPGVGARGGKPPISQWSAASMYSVADIQNKLSGGKFAAQKKFLAQQALHDASKRLAGGDMGAMGQYTKFGNIVAGMQRAGTGSRIMSAVMSTRVGMGAGGMQISPLIGRIVPLLGKLAGPVGLAVTAVTAFAAAVQHGAEVMGKFADLKFSTGASWSGANQLMGLDYAIGNVGSRVAGFKGAVNSGGAAAGFAAQAGINPNFSVFGNRNEGDAFLKYFKQILNAKSDDEADRMAYAIGQRDLVKYRYLTDDQKKRMMSGMGLSKQDGILSTQAGFEVSEFGKQWDKFSTILARDFLPQITELLRTLNAWLSAAEPSEQQREKMGQVEPEGFWAKAWAKTAPGGIQYGINKARARFAPDEKVKAAADKAQSAQERHIKAIDENTRKLGEVRDVLGGGARAKKAVPSGIQGQYVGDAAYRQALNSGLI